MGASGVSGRRVVNDGDTSRDGKGPGGIVTGAGVERLVLARVVEEIIAGMEGSGSGGVVTGGGVAEGVKSGVLARVEEEGVADMEGIGLGGVVSGVDGAKRGVEGRVGESAALDGREGPAGG